MLYLKGLDEWPVFSFFEQLTQIPRASGHEEKIASFLCDFAQAHGFWYHCDTMHNVLIRKPGTHTLAHASPVILQGHLDMVCEKRSGTEHDFSAEPLQLALDDDWITARDTTLGADDGIAVAMMLALLDADPATCVHPPLECLFTVQEEIGLCGAGAFDASLLQGRRLINLDSEDEGRVCVGCAGGVRCDFVRAVLPAEPNTLPLSDAQLITLRVDHLAGGHSGMDIGLGRTNANVLCLTLIDEVRTRFPGEVTLASVHGGGMDNAIARTAEATLFCSSEAAAFLRTRAASYQKTFCTADRCGTITIQKQEEMPATVLRETDTEALLQLVRTLPNGVICRSRDFEGLVDVSANLGICHADGTSICCSSSLRAMTKQDMETQKERFVQIARESGFTLSFRGEYPGWEYHPDSALCQLYVETYRDFYGADPVVETIHAGLECGIFCNKIPGLDAISFGPTMQHVHTPDERLSVSSVKRVWNHLCVILAKML